MSVWRSVLSLTRQYTCLVIPRTEVCLRVRSQNFHRSHGCLFESIETSIAKKAARKMAEKEREDTTTVTLKRDELKPGFMFPTKDTSSMMIDGFQYDQLPIIHLQATKNNTIASCDKHDGGGITLVSGGSIGFKNARKGTTVAAQAVGIDLGDKLLRREIKNVRILVKGIGVGRLPCIKGLQMAGVNVVSITDNTPIHTGKRPKKRRRV